MTPRPFLDTNIILRYYLGDNLVHSPRSRTLINAIRDGERTVQISDTVVFEVVFTLEKVYHTPRADIREGVLPVIMLPGIFFTGKHLMLEVFDRWIREPSLSFADSYHLSLAKSLGLTEIISFDRKIEKDPAVRRIEP